MDIKAKIEEIVEKIQSDKNLLANFQKEPIPTVEKLIGVDLPDDLIMNVVDGVKAKLAVDSVGDLLGGIKKLF
jgi:hypothetical protein